MLNKKLTNILPGLGWLILMALPFSCWSAPVSADGTTQKLDLYVSESKIIYLNKAVEDVTSSNPDIVGVERVRGMETQISVSGGAVGDAQVTVRMADATRVYQIKVSPMPQRVYINIPESKYLSFKNRIEDYNLSVPGVIRVVQPTEKELLLEALPLGTSGTRTTLTVFSKGEIYRYYISTFDNRGADLMEIQNAFTSRGYRQLTVKFSQDEATLSGSVSTQEELDDAIRIVKQFTPYVVVKAEVGQYVVQSEESEDERIIANNIIRISRIKGLSVRVKFAQPQETTSSIFTRVVGKPALSTSVTDNQTRLTTNNTQLPTDDGSPVNKNPVEGTLETTNISQDKSLPEKIFLFGDLEDDLEEARAIRVARTFCPYVVSMVTVKDPIQLRLKTRLLTVDLNKIKNTGVNWYSGTNTTSAPFIGGGIQTSSGKSSLMNTVALSLQTDVRFMVQLGENNNFIKQIQEIDLAMTNGQPASIFRGQNIPYSSTRTIDASGAISTSASYVSTGLRVLIVPLNFERGSQQPGEYLYLVDNDNQRIIGSMAKYFQLNRPIGSQPDAPLVDESVKYVDENGLIGINAFVQVSALEAMETIGPNITAPRTASKTSMARAHLREGQSLVIGGILDDALQKAIKSVPGLNKLPIFGFLFDSTNKTNSTAEMVIVFTPQIVRMKEGESKRLSKPHLPETMDLMQQAKLIPSVKPVRYDARGVDLRPDIMSLPKSIETRPAEVPEPKPAPAPREAEAAAKPVPVPLMQTPDVAPPAPVEVAKAPVKDTADITPPPAPAPVAPVTPLVEVPSAPQGQPKVDTVAPRVNNGESNQTEIPPTLP